MNDPLRDTVRTDSGGVLTLLGTVIGFLAGGAAWLYLLYDPSVTEQSMIWFLGAFVAAFVGAYLGKWAVVALLTR